MYLEARPESWLEDKKGEFRLAYKEHATARPNQNMLYCAGALFDAMQPWRDWDCPEKVPRGVSVLARISAIPSLEKRGLFSGRGKCVPNVP